MCKNIKEQGNTGMTITLKVYVLEVAVTDLLEIQVMFS